MPNGATWGTRRRPTPGPSFRNGISMRLPSIPSVGRNPCFPILEFPGRGALVWCRSSGPGASDLQEFPGDSEPAWERMARKLSALPGADNLGLVVGGTSPAALKRTRQILPGGVILVPGIGSQGGDLRAAVLASVDERGRRAIICASRAVSDCLKGPSWAASTLRADISAVLTDLGFPLA